jgi:predicted butyrate kinase (DUF1464 family)
MPRVIGIDPGTVSIDVCGIDDGRVFLDRAMPTAEALATPTSFVRSLAAFAPLDLIAGPSGYGLPLVSAQDMTDADLRLACLAAEGEAGGIGGLGALMRMFARSRLPIVFTPGVVHLASVPAHRKVNRVDMGTADKVCAAALAIHDQAARRGCRLTDVSLILLELGGAFTAVMAIEGGRIVDGAGGTSGPIGVRGSGALDGEVAFLAGSVSKDLLFGGGAIAIGGRVASLAYVESAVKAVAAMAVSLDKPRQVEIVLSGRQAGVPEVREEFALRLARAMPGSPLHVLSGFAATSKQAAQGAALVADGLAGGAAAELVETMGLRQARGTVLDYLFVIPPSVAKARIGVR